MRRLVLPLPPSANQYWRAVRGRVLLSKEARIYRERCAILAAAQWKGGPLAGPVRVHADVFMPDRRGDLTNRSKQLWDALEGTVFMNDSQIHDERLVRHLDKANPRVELTIEAMEAA